MRATCIFKAVLRLLVLVWGTVLPASLTANVVVQTLEFRLFDSSPAVALTFNPVDPSLGFITTVRAEVESTRRTDVGVWRTGGTDPEISFTAVLSGSNLSVEGQVTSFESAVFSFTQTMPLVSFSTATTGINLFRDSYAQNAEPEAASGYKMSNDSPLTRTFTLPLTFDGKLDLTYDAGFWNAQSQNTLSTWKVDIVGKVKLTYEYSTIPEPSTSAVWTAGLVSCAAVLWRRRLRLVSQRSREKGCTQRQG